jgi:hypothetical protein
MVKEAEQLEAGLTPKTTPEDFQRILDANVDDVYFEELDRKGCVEEIAHRILPEGLEVPVYYISINKLTPEVEQKLTLVHEIVHIHRGSVPNKDRFEEEMVELEAREFYEQNKDLVDQVFLRLKEEKAA